MKRSKFIIVFVCFAAFVLLSFNASHKQHNIKLPYPKGWPKPSYNFNQNPLTEEGIAFGRQLFYDPILSIDSTISCASCHLSYSAFTHIDHALSHGVHDSIGTRNSPVLINLAWNKHFMWDGAIHHLDMQPLAPISHPAEMNSNISIVVQKLQRLIRYKRLCQNAFNDSNITGQYVLKALAQFQLSLVCSNTKYDSVMAHKANFSAQEKAGYLLFKKNCASCHSEPLFTNRLFADNGLGVDSFLNDYGRWGITHKPVDSLQFKIPTLRNIEFSYPYMHDGRYKTLREVIRYYATGINRKPSSSLIPEKGFQFDERQQTDLVSFLLTLSDKQFLFNPEYAYPKK